MYLFIFLSFYRNCFKFYAKNVDPDHRPHFAASDLGLHCLPITQIFLNMEFAFKYGIWE